MSRTSVRQTFAEDVRLALLEEDVDTFDRRLEEAVKHVAKEIGAMRKSQRYLTSVGVAILLALIGALAGIAFK